MLVGDSRDPLIIVQLNFFLLLANVINKHLKLLRDKFIIGLEVNIWIKCPVLIEFVLFLNKLLICKDIKFVFYVIFN